MDAVAHADVLANTITDVLICSLGVFAFSKANQCASDAILANGYIFNYAYLAFGVVIHQQGAGIVDAAQPDAAG